MGNGSLWILRVFGRALARDVFSAWRRVFPKDNADARLVLTDLALYCRMGSSSFVAGDPYQTAFNEGARDVFLHITEMLNMDANTIVQLLEKYHHDH